MLSKFNVKNSSNDLNKLLKMIYFDKVNMVMK